jgi:hypothetical protein
MRYDGKEGKKIATEKEKKIQWKEGRLSDRVYGRKSSCGEKSENKIRWKKIKVFLSFLF